MELFISLIMPLILFAGGAFSLYILVDFLAYLKKNHIVKWKEMCFERPFGIPPEDFFFYPVQPLRLINFLFSEDDIRDTEVTLYKKKIKLSFIGILSISVIFFFVGLFS